VVSVWVADKDGAVGTGSFSVYFLVGGGTGVDRGSRGWGRVTQVQSLGHVEGSLWCRCASTTATRKRVPEWLGQNAPGVDAWDKSKALLWYRYAMLPPQPPGDNPQEAKSQAVSRGSNSPP
jgi:hypothetical protein